MQIVVVSAYDTKVYSNYTLIHLHIHIHAYIYILYTYYAAEISVCSTFMNNVTSENCFTVEQDSSIFFKFSKLLVLLFGHKL